MEHKKYSSRAIRDDYKFSIILASIVFLSFASIWNIEFIGNLLISFILPFSVLAIPVWIIVLIIKWFRSGCSRLLPILIAVSPVLIIPVLKIQQALEPAIFLHGTNHNAIDGEELKLYTNGSFIYQNSGLLGTKRYPGNHTIQGDSIILTFEKDRPEYIKNNTTKWIIEGDQFIEPFEELYFDIKK